MSNAGSPVPQATFPKQAIVVIHGMGEQTPMDTIRGFVRAVWETDDAVTQNNMPNSSEVWSKPDGKTGSLELRRITTRQSTPTHTYPSGVRSDFYELYWADLSGGSTARDIENWFAGLLWRNPVTRVPPRLLALWLMLWLMTAFIIYLMLAPVLGPQHCFRGICPYGWVSASPFLSAYWVWIGPLIGIALSFAFNKWIVPNFGRVVRYTRARPENIAARKAIRERGMALLDALHDGTYDRIIIVGHSLGSILAYDLISYFWASRLASHTFNTGDTDFKHLVALELAAAKCRENPLPPDIAEYLSAQRTLAHALRDRPKPKRQEDGKLTTDTRWIISDFITLGSPLTHSEFLLTPNLSDFQDKVASREYPVCPPVRETLDPINQKKAIDAEFNLIDGKARLIGFPFGHGQWQLHHGAPFSVTRWTNIYDPACLVLGDIVSGPLGSGPGHKRFGPCVVDINLKTVRGPSWWFTHTRYWSLLKGNKPSPALTELRKALDLAGTTLTPPKAEKAQAEQR